MRLSVSNILLFFAVTASAQYFKSFETYDESNSTELIYEIQKNKREEVKAYREGNEVHSYIYRQTHNKLRSYILNGHIIKSDTIDKWVKTIHDFLISKNPRIKPASKILISRNGLSNAVSYVDGTIIINLGLLTRIRNEGELAFILAHEMAHYHLEHQRERVIAFVSKDQTAQVTSKLKKIPEGNMTINDLEFVQGWFNHMYRNTREQELQADSLALEMVKAAGYRFSSIVGCFDHLVSIYHPFYPLKRTLFDAFIFDELPFKQRWLQPKRIEYNKSFMQNLVNNDTLISHPDVEQRKNSLISYTSGKPITQTDDFQRQLDQRLKFEMINSFEFYGRYDLAAHTCLQLMKEHPENRSYLNFRLGRILHKIALAKNDNRVEYVVSPYTDHFHNESKALNNFFYNLTVPEMAEIAYLYISKNFDEANPDHYRVKIECSQLTMRLKEVKQLKKEFHSRFPKEKVNRYSDAR